ncbi:MAG: alpha-glucan family phosphorylase [Deltaproteobacteria bacterium]|nr:alpha-glucan family phosphorylase [Deltaproteobacteria bacterium]
MTGSTTEIVQRMHELARNFWWAWEPEISDLFRDLDPELWSEVNHNPILLLKRLAPEVIADRAQRRTIESRVVYALRRLEEYLSGEGSYGHEHAASILGRPVAYFSAEFGIHESLPVYAGGLGVLAGDHLKASSDLGIPIVGVGLFYAEGYFRQHLDETGYQQEAYGEIDVESLPIHRAQTPDGENLRVTVDTAQGPLHAEIWKAPVGRNTLLLLDSNVEGNTPENRSLTARLYSGDQSLRLRQEILLGIGGHRALVALGIHPSVIHMNEGHSALATLEAMRVRVKEDGCSFAEALREVSQMSVFTTHTPVPAGHDRFSPELVEQHLGKFREGCGCSLQDFLALGRVNPADPSESFCMTVVGLKTTRQANGVSSLHGHVSRQMWQELWPDRPEQEIPIGHVTNGVHVSTWIAPQLLRIYQRHLPQDFEHRLWQREAWAPVAQIDDGELWEGHQIMRNRLVDFARNRTGRPGILDPSALTLGFARRFATYKRAVLMLSDIERLERLLCDPERPVQIVFAGKAHPHDEPGKAFIRRIHELSHDPRFDGKIVFLENYDLRVGRALVRGVDAWVNNPRRPLEACGTSGQKVVLNGGLNISVLDGWWAEAYDGTNGFAIGGTRVHRDVDVQDERDAESLYRVLEEEVVPLFYDRGSDGVPHAWVSRMKRGLTTCAWRFSASRMVRDYLHQAYLPAAGADWVG